MLTVFEIEGPRKTKERTKGDTIWGPKNRPTQPKMRTKRSQRGEPNIYKGGPWDKISNICHAAVSMHLNQQDAIIMLNYHLLPHTTYGIQLSKFTTSQCHQVNVKVINTFLPPLKINRRTPWAAVHDPLQYSWMGVFKHGALQDEWGLHYLTQTLRWVWSPAADVITTRCVLQLVSGFVSHIIVNTRDKIGYLPPGWLDHIHIILHALNGSLHIKQE